MKNWGFTLFLYACFTLQSCSSKDDSTKILNDVFLSVVDTIGYKYHTLRPAPKDSVFAPSTEKILISVYDKLSDIHEWHRNILYDLNEKSYEHAEDYKRLYQSTLMDTAETKLDVLKLKNVGRFQLFANNNSELPNVKDLQDMYNLAQL